MKLANLFGDGAVFQRDIPVTIWGETKPTAVVFASIGGMTGAGCSGADGKFRLQLPPLPAGGPYELRVRNRDTGEECVSKDILVGEVWLASGQSNMEFRMNQSEGQLRDFIGEKRCSGRIRRFHVPRCASGAVESDCNAHWQAADEETIGDFFAVALWFASKLERELDVPVGILESAWGGTYIQAWTGRQALMRHPYDAREVLFNESLFRDPAVWEKIDSAALARGDAPLAQFCPPDPGNKGFPAGWASPEFDDSQWTEFALPGNWTADGLAGNGVVWVRRQLELPEAWAGRDLILHTGGIDKTDITYFNGVEIGATGEGFDTTKWHISREYRVPGKLVKAGRNLIAIRAYSFCFDGQFLGPETEYWIAPADGGKRISFSGACRFRCEVDFGFVKSSAGGNLGPGCANTPSVLFDGMICPLIGYAMRGAIWYQGETNATTQEAASHYGRQMRNMIADWRYRWGQGDFPFYQVQLANFRPRAAYDRSSIWAVLREGQRRAALDPNCGMAVAIDVGEAEDIHPKDKRSVGDRLARLALHDVFHREDIVARGPFHTAVRQCGRELRIEFGGCDGGLKTADGGAPAGFYLAGMTGAVFYPAEARIEGNAVICSCDQEKLPLRVRYGWSDNPEVNLVNGAGLPASPFEASAGE